jgi:outer membrane protein OmpA-like peptidoglycan-associated protein
MVNDGQRNTPVGHGTASAVRTRPHESDRDARRSAALLELANRLATAEVPRARRNRSWWIITAAAAVVAVTGVMGIVLTLSDRPSAGTPAGSVSLIAPQTTTARTTTVATTAKPVTTTAVAVTRAATSASMTYQDRTLTLQGAVTSQAVADAALARARAALAPERVIGGFAVDPRAGPAPDVVEVETSFVVPRDAQALPASLLPELGRLAALMKAYPRVELEVTGHTDSSGSEAYNLRLSMSRAEAVADFLVGAGVDRSRVTALGKGETEPVADNATAAGRALNRRIEIQTRDT